VLAAQISTFVDHAVAGQAAKLAQLVSADVAAVAGDEPVAQARVAARVDALQTDLQTLLLATVSEPAANGAVRDPSLVTAATNALVALGGLQVGAAALLAANPDGIAFTLPLTLPDGPVTARLRIDRDAPEGHAGPCDGENFHVAFILDTRRLGSVAIDVLTVGRAVTLTVNTEGERARRAFAAALPALEKRLETLRYRVAKTETRIAPRAAPVTTPAPAPQASTGPALRGTDGHVDIDA
jgi:hypothetical protein